MNVFLTTFVFLPMIINQVTTSTTVSQPTIYLQESGDNELQIVPQPGYDEFTTQGGEWLQFELLEDGSFRLDGCAGWGLCTQHPRPTNVRTVVNQDSGYSIYVLYDSKNWNHGYLGEPDLSNVHIDPYGYFHGTGCLSWGVCTK